MKNLVTGIVFLMFANVAFAQGLAQDVDTLETNVSALDSDVDTLEGQVASLQTENAALEAVIDTQASLIADLTAVVDDLVALQRCHAIGGSMGRTVSEDGGNHGVDWRGCDKRLLALLVNADLRGTDFSGAYILGVHFGGARLAGANFTDANLSGSNLEGADIISYQQAQDYAHLGLQQTIFSNTICPDDTNSDDNGGTCANNRTP
jgi:uncharacterized protein YjbI with pentapeptide repeats